MKRSISLVLVMAMALSMVPAGLAEEFFAEEEFAAEESFESEGFFEEEFFAEESAETEEVEEIDMEEEAAELEDRSIVSLWTDQQDSAQTDAAGANYWKTAPVLEGKPSTKKGVVTANSVTLQWTWPASLMMPGKKGDVQASKLPKNVKWYVYEIDEETGVAYQVGKALGMKTFKQPDKSKLYGGTVTLKNVPSGEHKYFVRAEELTKQKDKTSAEVYGVSSNVFAVTVDESIATLWKKLNSIKALQVGENLITVLVDAKEALTVEQYDVTVKASKPKGFVADPAKISKKLVSGNSMLINDTNEYVAGAKVTYTVTPVKNNVKGTKKSVSVTVQGDLWKSKPDIDSAMVIGKIGTQPQVRMTFVPVSTEAQDIAFIVSGFAASMFVKKTDSGWGAFDKKNNPVANTEVSEDDGCITVTSVIKKAGAKVNFTVQPQASEPVMKKGEPTGKFKTVKGTKSAKYVLATQKDALSGATNIQTESTKEGLVITWFCANPNADYFNVSLVEQGKDFKDSKAAYEPNVKAQTVTFPGIDVGDYTVFVETILTNGGRIVTEFSFSYNAEMTSEKLFKPEISEANLKSITDNSPYVNKDVVVVIDGAQPGDQFMVRIDGEDTLIEYGTDGLIIDLLDIAGPGEHTIKIAGYENGDTGTWSDPITVAAYDEVKVELKADAEKIIVDDKVTLTATATGGAGGYTYTFYQNGTEVQSGEKSEYVFTGPALGEYKFTVEVKDSVVTETATSDEVTVKVGDEVDDENGHYTFKLVDDKNAYLVATSYEKTVTAVEKVPATIRGRTVVRIGAADATEGVFQGFTALTSIELPNTIEVIGANAFNGCTKLATMTCY